MNLKKISCKLEKMTLYIVILTMFKFTGIEPLPATMVIELELLGTYKIISGVSADIGVPRYSL